MGTTGTHLKNILERLPVFRFKPCGDCKRFMRVMNKQGPDWCENNIPLIVNRMRNAARQRKLPFARWFAIRLIKRSIKLSRAKKK